MGGTWCHKNGTSFCPTGYRHTSQCLTCSHKLQCVIHFRVFMKCLHWLLGPAFLILVFINIYEYMKMPYYEERKWFNEHTNVKHGF